MVGDAVARYADRRPALIATTEHYLALVTRLLDDAGINYLSVTARTKSVASFAARPTAACTAVGSTPTRRRRSPTRSASASSPTCGRT